MVSTTTPTQQGSTERNSTERGPTEQGPTEQTAPAELQQQGLGAAEPAAHARPDGLSAAPTLATVLRETVKATPVLGQLASTAARRYRVSRFPGSATFWERHYAAGRDSGPGSFGHLAQFKAGVIAELCTEKAVESVVEWGCGDGNQLLQLIVPRYVGLDVSRTAVESCVRRFGGDQDKSFFWYDPAAFLDNAGFFTADLALSLDVIYHLVEDVTFSTYMRRLFHSARRHVLIYSSDVDGLRHGEPHVRDRRFSSWIEHNEPDWHLEKTIRNQYPFTGSESAGSFSDFFCYTRGGC
jgi:hypothetical protein